MDRKKFQFLYIMGRGHSGSTVLDALLGNGENMHSIGEIVSGMPRTEDVCSCGKKIKECDFWVTVKEKFEEESGLSWKQATAKIQGQAHIKSFVKTLWPSDQSEINQLKEINKTLFKVISKVSEKKLLIDSSKEFTRGLFLTKYASSGKTIHLIRNPLQILASNMLRIKEGRFKILRYTFEGKTTAFPFIFLSALGWLIGNALGELIGLVGKGKVLKIRYEDLCENPARELKRIETFLECDLSDVIRKVEKRQEMKIKHMIAGNRMRRKGSFVFNPNRQRREKLPLGYSILGLLITWPLMLTYGYLHDSYSFNYKQLVSSRQSS